MPPQQQVPQSYNSKPHGRGTLIALIIVTILLMGAISFGVWAYMERTDYKNNVDEKVNAAVEVAVQEESSRKDAEFIQREKEPTKTYEGPSAYGSVEFEYPKTWSAYVIENDKSREQIEAYFHPNFVPDIRGETAFALRMMVVDKSYAEVLESYGSKVRAGKLKLAAYKPKNVKNVSASQITGEINQGQNDTMVVIELRDKTLQIWTESNSFVPDLNKFVLSSLKFSP